MQNITPLRAFADNYIWVLRSPPDPRVAVVDPGDEDPVLEYLSREGLRLGAILITHHHGDHTGGIRGLLEAYPHLPLVMTTVTPTGARRVADLFGDRVIHSYIPYDMPGAVVRFFDRFNPRLAVIMETELWPNLFAECGARGVPLVLANARISPRSVHRYRRFGGLFRSALVHGVVELVAQNLGRAGDDRGLGVLLAVPGEDAHMLRAENFGKFDQLAVGQSFER